MGLRPFGNRIVVVDCPATREAPSGLVLPDGADVETTKRGIVVSAPGHADDSGYPEQWRVDAGDVVHYTHGRRIGDHYVVDQVDVVAVETDPEGADVPAP